MDGFVQKSSFERLFRKKSHWTCQNGFDMQKKVINRQKANSFEIGSIENLNFWKKANNESANLQKIES